MAAPVFEIHAPLSGDPQPERTLKAPVTEVDFYRTDDIEVNPDSKPAAAIHDMVVRVNYHIESLQLPGYISQNWGFAFEDGRWAIVLRGWESIEVRLLFLSLVLSFPLNTFFLLLLTGPHAFGHVG